MEKKISNMFTHCSKVKNKINGLWGMPGWSWKRRSNIFFVRRKKQGLWKSKFKLILIKLNVFFLENSELANFAHNSLICLQVRFL